METAVVLHTNNRKVREFAAVQDSGWIDLMKSLDTCSLLITNQPLSDEQMILLKQFIASQFKDFSPKEIEAAFMMYSGGKLDFDGSKITRMSSDFVGGILIAYRRFRNKEMIRYNQENTKQISKNTETKMSDEDHYNSIVKHIERNASLPDWGGNIYLPAYQWADKNEMKATNEDKQKFIDLAKEKIAFDLKELRGQNNTIAQAKIQIIRDFTNNEVSFKNHCRVEFLKQFLTKKYSL